MLYKAIVKLLTQGTTTVVVPNPSIWVLERGSFGLDPWLGCWRRSNPNPVVHVFQSADIEIFASLSYFVRRIGRADTR